jgi:hypothetical protein
LCDISRTTLGGPEAKGSEQVKHVLNRPRPGVFRVLCFLLIKPLPKRYLNAT